MLHEEYTYGASRERLKVETSSQRRYFAWGGQNVVAEYVETGSGTTPEYSKAYIYAGSRLFMTATKASSTTETKEFHHPDRLGTQLVTEGSTGSSFRQSTMPFGTAISTETTGNTKQVFTSYDRSGTTGLDYAQNRTYSKGQSRFTQVDPIAMASASLGSPQSNNLYAYVQNMPTDFIDPSGLLMTIEWDCRTVFRVPETCVTVDGVPDCAPDWQNAGWVRICTLRVGTSSGGNISGGSVGGGGTNLTGPNGGNPSKWAECAAAAREANKGRVQAARERNRDKSTDLSKGDWFNIAGSTFIGTITGGGKGAAIGLGGGYILTKMGKYMDKYGDEFFETYYDDKLVAALKQCQNAYGSRR